MRVDVVQVANPRKARVTDGHRQNLIVRPLFIAHVQHTNRSSGDVAARKCRFVDYEECIQRIAIRR